MNDDAQKKLESADDLAIEALSEASKSGSASAKSASKSNSAKSTTTDEVAESDELAETLNSLQNVIERNAQELESLKKKLKEKREMLRNVFDNDQDLSQAQEQAQQYTSEVKERKAKLQSDPQVTTYKVEIGELNEQKKEIEEALSNHLVNYYSLTNSKSFDTSDGDQWEFDVKAKVKPRRKSKSD